jgi:hypothetical protein
MRGEDRCISEGDEGVSPKETRGSLKEEFKAITTEISQ